MADAATSTPIPLARSRPRLLAVPIVAGLAGVVAMASGFILVGGVLGTALGAVGAVVTVLALVGALLLTSVRLRIEDSALILQWLFGRRRYVLTAGPVTRVRLRGRNRSRLRVRSGALGWGIGRARLRDEEEIELVRLAATPTAILVPTERGRLAIAPASDDVLLAALAGAAQARQRWGTPAPEAEQPEAPVSAEVARAPDEAEAPPMTLTGIERSLLEERLASEHANASRAEIERLAADEAAAMMAHAEAERIAAATEAEAAHPIGRSKQRLATSVRAIQPRPSWGFVLLPTAAAGITWWVGMAIGGLPAAGSDLSRLTVLALVLAGPASSVAAIVALAWWPRLVGVVVAGGLTAAVFVGRALIGG